MLCYGSHRPKPQNGEKNSQQDPKLCWRVSIGLSHRHTNTFTIPLRSTPEVSQKLWRKTATSGHIVNQRGLWHQNLPMCQQDAVGHTTHFPGAPEVLMDGMGAKGISVLCSVDATQTPWPAGPWLWTRLSRAGCASILPKGLLKQKHKYK